jgi:hypothetical protein
MVNIMTIASDFDFKTFFSSFMLLFKPIFCPLFDIPYMGNIIYKGFYT